MQSLARPLIVILAFALAAPAFAQGRRGSRKSPRYAAASTGKAESGSTVLRSERRKPYSALVSADFSYLSSSRTTKSEFGESEPTSSSDMVLNFNALLAAGPVFVGPLLGYRSQASGEGEDAVKTSTLDAGGMIDVPFLDLHRETAVPHVYGALRYNTELGAMSEEAATGYRMGVGIGLYYFLGRNLAFDPRIEFQKQTLESGGEYKVTSDSTIVGAAFGLAAFL